MRAHNRALLHRQAGVLLFFAVLAGTLGCASHQAATPGTAGDPPSDPLVDLNHSFRQLYADARASLLSATEPIIYVNFDSLVLIHGGQTREEGFTPPIYDQLKAVAHVPLALFVLADSLGQSPLTDDHLASLAAYREQVVTAAASLAGRGFEPEILDRQGRIVEKSLALIDDILESGRAPSREALSAFAAGQRDLVLANAFDAAEAQLDGLHALTSRWREELGDAWPALQVVVSGGRQARAGNLQHSFFERLLGKEAVGERLFYAESIHDQQGALALLGTILLDRRAGEAFFDEPYRLERDLLADATQEILNRIFGSNAQGSRESELFAVIARADAELFDAFNACDLASTENIFAKDLEFYHDITGVTDYAQTMASSKANCDRNLGLRRELVEGTLEVYPLGDEGAIQVGQHTFCHLENGKDVCGTFKFVHVWRRVESGWRLARVVSYDH